MHQTSNGSGNGNGSGAKPLAKVLFRPDALLTPAPLSPSAETEVLFKTEEGAVLHGSLVRMTRHSIVFEMYHPAFMPRLSEVLQKFTIIVQRQKVYSGRAVVSNLMDASSKILYEATLDEIYWQDFNLLPAPDQEEQLAQKFKDFLKEWQKFYKLLPEFKVVIADMQTFFHEVRIWLDKVEAEVYLHPPGKGGERTRFEHQILQRVEKAVLPPLAHLFQRFETAAAKVEKELRPHHASYAKYALHPAVLCAPFMYRTFQKPLGYAGDYEMVNMMVLNPYQGDSIFAKILNAFFLRTPPVAAHRNRIDYLAGMLESEAYRLSKRKKPIRVLNLGCGPAAEIQRFLGYSFLSHKASLTLLDFEDEAIRFTKRALKYVKEQSGRDCEIHVIKKSVTQFLKETPGPFSQFKEGHYDVVYCAGLFDYLSDDICSRLLDIFYGLTAPEGLMLVSNVDSSNPSRGWMELVVDWHLVYRNSLELARLFPPSVPKDSIHITAEPTSVNVFAEVRKPQHA